MVDISARVDHGHQGGRGKGSSKKQAAGIAHEEPRGFAVPVQKPGEASHDGHEKHHDERAERSGKQPREKCRRDQRDATREPIHVVEKVQRVHHAAEPDDGEQRDRPRKAATERPRDEEHGKRAHDERRHELRERRQLQAVIDHAEDEHGRGCPRHRQFERTIGRTACQQNGRGSRGQRGHGKSHTSHARCGDGVPPVFTRRCNQDGTPQSNSPDDGAEGKRQDRCEES